jgi:hypothetical protein
VFKDTFNTAECRDDVDLGRQFAIFAQILLVSTYPVGVEVPELAVVTLVGPAEGVGTRIMSA